MAVCTRTVYYNRSSTRNLERILLPFKFSPTFPGPMTYQMVAERQQQQGEGGGGGGGKGE